MQVRVLHMRGERVYIYIYTRFIAVSHRQTITQTCHIDVAPSNVSLGQSAPDTFTLPTYVQMFNVPSVIIMKQISRQCGVLDRSPFPSSSFSLMLQLIRPVIILQPAINGQEIDYLCVCDCVAWMCFRCFASFDLRDRFYVSYISYISCIIPINI